MKLFELVSTLPLSEEESLIELIRNADWKYEFSEDTQRQKLGQAAMERLEQIVFEFWKTNPARAVELWNMYSPVSPCDKTVIPSFIITRSMQ